VEPRYFDLDAMGRILVADANFSNGLGGIIRVDPGTGAQTVVASGGLFNVGPIGLALGPAGEIFVSNSGLVLGTLVVQIIRVDPGTGAMTLVSSGSGAFSPEPSGIALDPMGRIIVADALGAFAGRIIRVDPLTGAQTTLSSGLNLVDPFDVVVDATGQILVADAGPARRIIRVDPATGVQTVISSGGSFVTPADVRVVPAAAVPEPGTLVLLGSGLLGAAAWARKRPQSAP
jgi:sugar lactone lactonase YvrE